MKLGFLKFIKTFNKFIEEQPSRQIIKLKRLSKRFDVSKFDIKIDNPNALPCFRLKFDTIRRLKHIIEVDTGLTVDISHRSPIHKRDIKTQKVLVVNYKYHESIEQDESLHTKQLRLYQEYSKLYESHTIYPKHDDILNLIKYKSSDEDEIVKFVNGVNSLSSSAVAEFCQGCIDDFLKEDVVINE